MDPSNGKKAVRIIEIKSETQPHRENLKDDYDKVAQRALEEKKNQALDDWFTQKMSGFYINVSKDYASCPEVKDWTGESTTASN